MLESLKRKVMSAMLLPILVSRPVKSGVVAITFHNILASQMPWFDSVCRVVTEHYKVIDPYDFQCGQYIFGSHDLQVMFTFDDGFSSNIKVAKECMSNYGIKGLFFLTEEFIGKNINESYHYALEHFYPGRTSLPELKQEYTAMSWNDVEWLLDNGHCIGAHTKTHPNLSNIQDEFQLKDEVVASADRMENRLGFNINCFAYPFGSISSISKLAITNAMLRFSYSFSNVRGNMAESPNNYFLFRQNLVPNDPMWLVRAMIEGRLDWKYKNERDQSRHFLRNVKN